MLRRSIIGHLERHVVGRMMVQQPRRHPLSSSSLGGYCCWTPGYKMQKGGRQWLSSTAVLEGEKKKKEMSDLFFDNVGTLFLSTIALIIAALVRSSYNSSNRIAARETLEQQTALDPGEIHDLQMANGPDLNYQVMTHIVQQIRTSKDAQQQQQASMTYTTFVSRVLHIMRTNYDPQFTIQLGHFLDRLALNLVQQQTKTTSTTTNENGEEDQLDLDLLLTMLSLAMNGSIQERVDVLFQIMSSSSSSMQESSMLDTTTTTTSAKVAEGSMKKMMDHLQKTCQLVPDAQILETPQQKYPTQQYHVASSEEMISIAKESQKDKLSSPALNEQQWDCHDFHLLLRSKAICAWGECYHKTTLSRSD